MKGRNISNKTFVSTSYSLKINYDIFHILNKYIYINMYKFYSSYPVFNLLVGGSSSLSQKQRRKVIHDRRKAKAQQEQQLREAKHERRRAKSRLDTEAAGGSSAVGPAVEENPCANNDAMGPIQVNSQCDGKEDSVTYEIIPKDRGVCSGKHCYSIDTLRRIAREGNNRDPQTRRFFNASELANPRQERFRPQWGLEVWWDADGDRIVNSDYQRMVQQIVRNENNKFCPLLTCAPLFSPPTPLSLQLDTTSSTRDESFEARLEELRSWPNREAAAFYAGVEEGGSWSPRMRMSSEAKAELIARGHQLLDGR